MVPFLSSSSSFFFLKDFYLFARERDHKYAMRQAEAERETGSPLSKEPDAGLEPRTPGS